MSKVAQLAPIQDADDFRRQTPGSKLAQWARVTREEWLRKWLGTDFEQRLATLRTRYGSDTTGVSTERIESVSRLCAFFHRFYFRTEIHGIEHVPECGRAIIVANHSGQIPIDAAILGCSLLFDAKTPRLIRAMVDRWVGHLPFVAEFFSDLGSVVGTPTVAKELLHDEELLLIFPEGIRGISKPFTRRYQLQPFGHGFMRLALDTHTPIIPAAIIGAEEQYFSLGNSEALARFFRMPVYPLIPQIYLPLGQLPLPTKYRIHFGEPLRFHGAADASPNEIGAKVHVVQKAVQSLLGAGLAQRRGVFF